MRVFYQRVARVRADRLGSGRAGLCKPWFYAAAQPGVVRDSAATTQKAVRALSVDGVAFAPQSGRLGIPSALQALAALGFNEKLASSELERYE